MSNTELSNVERAVAVAAGLRELAAMVTEHPQVFDAVSVNCTFGRMLVSVGHGGNDARTQLLAFARAGQAAGAEVIEHDDGVTWAGVDVAFGPVCLHVYAGVEKVHDVTRIVEYTPRSILAEIAEDAGCAA